MELTRIIQLTWGGGPRLYLLGGAYSLDDGVGVSTPGVWELQWNTTSQSYYWDDELTPPMGELHLLYSCSHSILQGGCLLKVPQ